MNNKNKTENCVSHKLLKSISLIIFGGVVLWLVISHITHFNYPHWFYENNPNIETYIGTNIVSMWADFSFFTYLTMIIFGIWCLLLGISNITNFNKLNTFLLKDSLVCFVFCNYCLTTVLYTLFEFMSGNPTFGWYGNVPLSYHNVGTNIIGHYVFFIIFCVIFYKIKLKKSNSLKSYSLVTLFLISYYIIVKFLGEFAYNIRWFPYIIFDVKSFGNTFGITNYAINLILLIFSCALILFFYLFLYSLLIKLKNKQQV